MDLAVLSGGDFGQCGSVPDTKKIAFIAGCVLLLASVIVLLSLLTRKPVWKIVLTFLIVSDDIRGCGIEWWLRSPGKEQDNAVYILGKAADLMGIPQCVSCNLKRNIDDMLIRDRETVCMSPALQRTCNHYCKRRSHFKIQSGAEHTYWISVLLRKALTALFSIIE